jgi:hypothetical protein
MIGNTLWNYIFIRACISFLHWIAPLCILYCAIILCIPFFWFLDPAPSGVPLVVEGWVAAETTFYFFVYIPLKYYLQGAATHPPPAPREQRRKLFRRCHENVLDPERYLSKWFMDASPSEIKRENIKDFLRWAFLNAGESDPRDYEELEEYITVLEEKLGRKFEDGRGKAKCLRLTLDEVDMLHRSLTWYLVSS